MKEITILAALIFTLVSVHAMAGAETLGGV
jgi:hypothetical protein